MHRHKQTEDRVEYYEEILSEIFRRKSKRNLYETIEEIRDDWEDGRLTSREHDYLIRLAYKQYDFNHLLYDIPVGGVNLWMYF